MADTSQIQQMVIASAQQYGVPVNIALGIAAHESGFNPNATHKNPNSTTDWGVMQLNDLTIQTMGVSNPLDPQENIDAGVRLLASLLTKYSGDVRSALWAYASGPGNVGPNKTPNSIASSFIAYVMNYTPAVPIPAVPGSDAVLADSSAPSTDSTDTTDSSSQHDGSTNVGLLIGLGLGGLVLALGLSRLLD